MIINIVRYWVKFHLSLQNFICSKEYRKYAINLGKWKAKTKVSNPTEYVKYYKSTE